jgi:hypothetical protein
MYRKDAKGKEEVFLDPNTFLKTEQLRLVESIFLKMVQKLPMPSPKVEATGEK